MFFKAQQFTSAYITVPGNEEIKRGFHNGYFNVNHHTIMLKLYFEPELSQ